MSTPLLRAARHEVARQLSNVYGKWEATETAVLGPGTLAVVVDWLHGEPGHVDLGFVWNRNDPEAPITWDCAAGWGDSDAERAANSVERWIRCTAPALLEVLAQDGSFAVHLPAGDEIGLPNWRVVHGPVFAFGHQESADALQQWVGDHPLLPALGDDVAREIDQPQLNGVKFLFGSSSEGDTAEVRVNGTARESASESLCRLDWPRSDRAAFVRTFVVVIHPE
jgi:hypothetical protein